MRPGGLRRASWAALAGLGCATTAIVVAAAVPAQASVAVKEVYGRPASGTYQLLGHGWGHGHGLSQYGAQGAATLGKTADVITATYYPNTARAVQGNPTMRVLLSTDGRGTVREFVPASGQVMKNLAASPATTFSLPTSALRWRVTSDSAGLHVSYVDGAGTHAVSGTFAGPLQVSGGTYVRVRFSNGMGKDYRNAVRVLRSGASSLRSIAVMPMESYLYGVVPRESSASWAAAALQAQSIAARSYSEYKREHAPSTQGYDICDTTQCQVFGGSATYTNANDASTRKGLEATSTNDAVKATAGVIRTYGGKAVFAEFSASNGGWSTDGGTPYLVAKADPWDGVTGSSVHSWKATLPVTSLECRYGPKNGDGSCAKGADGNPLWRLVRLTITQRDGNGEWGGRVEAGTIDFVDGSGTVQSVDVTGSGFYYARTWPTYSDGLRSRWFRIVPEYDAVLVSRSTAPKLVLPPGASTGTLTTVLKNTGNAGWPVSGLHLALASPAGGADPLAGGSSRPGTYVGNLTTPGSTTVMPGEQAQFSIAVDSTGLPPGTRTASYRLRIGTAALFGPTIAWTVTIEAPRFTATPAAPNALVTTTYTQPTDGPPALFADARTVIVPRNGSTTLRLAARNTSNLTWPVGDGAPLRLGTSAPRDRSSSFSGTGWVSGTRAAQLSAPAPVEPAGWGTFDLVLNGNGQAAGVSKEGFEPLWDGKSWITGDTTSLAVVRVDPAVSRAAATELAPATGFTLLNAPNGTRTLVVRLRNVGADPWAVGSERLGTTAAAALASGWPSSTRTPALAANLSRPGQHAVYPGEVGEWRVPVSAFKHAAGTYGMTLRAVGPSGFYGPSYPVSIKVVNAVFAYNLQAVKPTVNVPRNGKALSVFYVKNTGNVAWPIGGALRSTVPSGSSPSRASNWYSATRPGSLSSNYSRAGATSVRPGEIGRFYVWLAGNGRTPRSTSEVFGMTWDGWKATALKATLAYRVV